MSGVERINKGRRVDSQGKPVQGLMFLLYSDPGFSLCSNPGLKLANAFYVFFKRDEFGRQSENMQSHSK